MSLIADTLVFCVGAVERYARHLASAPGQLSLFDRSEAVKTEARNAKGEWTGGGSHSSEKPSSQTGLSETPALSSVQTPVAAVVPAPDTPDRTTEGSEMTKTLRKEVDSRSGFAGFRVGQMVTDSDGTKMIVTSVAKPVRFTEGRSFGHKMDEGTVHAVQARPATAEEIKSHQDSQHSAALAKPVHEDVTPTSTEAPKASTPRPAGALTKVSVDYIDDETSQLTLPNGKRLRIPAGKLPYGNVFAKNEVLDDLEAQHT